MNHASHTRRLFEALGSGPVKDLSAFRNRLLWYYSAEAAIDPIFAHVMDDDEIRILAEWFRDTNDAPYLGETGFQCISFLSSLVLTNNIQNIVQLGHYAGFSSIVLGFMLRKVSPDARLISFDIDHKMTVYSRSWAEKAGLDAVVQHVCADSTDPFNLEIAGSHLRNDVDMLFIDASKQYQNTIAEVNMWSPYINGFVVAHDVSDVAKGDQANGALGVSDGLRDSAIFKPHELLLLDPKSAVRRGFPYQDPMGLGIGVVRGRERLPTMKGTNKRRILESEKLATPENWNLQEGFSLANNKLTKLKGRAAFAGCFSPIIGNQVLAFDINITKSNGGAVVVCGGGEPGTSSVIHGDGRHHGSFSVGNQNSIIAIYGPDDSEFEIDYFRVAELD